MLRLAGFTPYRNDTANSKITSVPEPLYVEHPVWGYAPAPGKYEVTLNDNLKYLLTIASDGSRWHPAYPSDSAERINIFGCSFFAGMGVDDTAVVSAYLQLILENYAIRNFSIPGHGLTTQYLQFKKQIAEGTKPKVAVFSIASFHLLRNTGSFRYLTNFGSIRSAPVSYPFAEIQPDELHFAIKKAIPPFPQLASASSFYTQLLVAADKFYYSDDYLMQLHHALADSIYQLASQHGVHPLFIVLTKDAASKTMEEYYAKQGYPFLQSAVDYQETGMNLMPVDGHPNARAHRLYAAEIAEYIMRHRFLDNVNTGR